MSIIADSTLWEQAILAILSASLWGGTLFVIARHLMTDYWATSLDAMLLASCHILGKLMFNSYSSPQVYLIAFLTFFLFFLGTSDVWKYAKERRPKIK